MRPANASAFAESNPDVAFGSVILASPEAFARRRAA
jgi:hypothetical protein